LHKVLFCGVAAVLAAGPAWADSFSAYLSPSPVTGGTRDTITGQGRANAELDGKRLTVSGDFHGMTGNATKGELRAGIGIGVPGPKLFDLTVTAGPEGKVFGMVTLSDSQVTQLRRGHVYVQIDSRPAPDGNLQGWLFPPHPAVEQDVPVQGHGFLPQLDVPQK
jgi:hypothetical protein